MARLIDTDYIKGCIYNKYCKGCRFEKDDFEECVKRECQVAVIMKSIIGNAPTVNTVKHGHWIYDGGFAYICSVCMESMEWTSPYCCECGACMDEEVNDGKTN